VGQGFAQIVLWILRRRRKKSGAAWLGGGYGLPIEATVKAHANTYRVALDIFGGNPRQRDLKPPP
jgi:hypothetical protein